MQPPSPHKDLDCCRFPQQKLLCENEPYSRDLLGSLLESIYEASLPFTGYIKFTDNECSLLFLFFYYGAPYAAGKFVNGKPVLYSIQELGRHLAKTAEGSISATLCETDPVLLKNMLLFLQEDPAVKAPPSLLDFEYIVRQIGESGEHAMIALCRDKHINFFYFKEGKGALVHYSDLAFSRPEGMTIDEEMLLYAFQPGEKVQAYIFRDITTTRPEDSGKLDKDSLYKLLTVGYLKDRRSSEADTSPMADENQKNGRKGDREVATDSAGDGFETLFQNSVHPSAVLSVESGLLQGERFTVMLPCTIGRKDCDLILDDRLVSRRHAELKIVSNKLVLEDLESKNGTKVNGTRIAKSQLAPNDLITIGTINLRISPA